MVGRLKPYCAPPASGRRPRVRRGDVQRVEEGRSSVRCYGAALGESQKAVNGKIKRCVAAIRDFSQDLELLVAQLFGTVKISHIDDIRLQQLIESTIHVVVDEDWDDRAPVDLGESVRKESERPQRQVDLAEYRLVEVKRNEGDLGVNRHSRTQLVPTAFENRKLRALHVDF